MPSVEPSVSKVRDHGHGAVLPGYAALLRGGNLLCQRCRLFLGSCRFRCGCFGRGKSLACITHCLGGGSPRAAASFFKAAKAVPVVD